MSSSLWLVFLKEKELNLIGRSFYRPIYDRQLDQLSAKLELVNRTGKLQDTWQRNNGHFFCCSRHFDVMLGCQGWGKNVIQSLLRIKCSINFLGKWSLAESKPGRDNLGNKADGLLNFIFESNQNKKEIKDPFYNYNHVEKQTTLGWFCVSSFLAICFVLLFVIYFWQCFMYISTGKNTPAVDPSYVLAYFQWEQGK